MSELINLATKNDYKEVRDLEILNSNRSLIPSHDTIFVNISFKTYNDPDRFKTKNWNRVVLSSSEFECTILTRHYLLNSNILHTAIHNCYFNRVNIIRSSIHNVDILESTIENAYIRNSKINMSHISNINFLSCIFDTTTFDSVVFKNCSFVDCIFMDCDLSTSSFDDCEFVREAFYGTQYPKVDY